MADDIPAAVIGVKWSGFKICTNTLFPSSVPTQRGPMGSAGSGNILSTGRFT
jgi:hypothetical protein